MTEFTVHFQKGTRVGARALRMVHVEADTAAQAIKLAKTEFNGADAKGYRVTRVDYFDADGRIVIA